MNGQLGVEEEDDEHLQECHEDISLVGSLGGIRAMKEDWRVGQVPPLNVFEVDCTSD